MAHLTSAILASMSRSPEETFARLEQHGLLSPLALSEREAVIAGLGALLRAVDAEFAAQSPGGSTSQPGGGPPPFGHRWLGFLAQGGYLSTAEATPSPSGSPGGGGESGKIPDDGPPAPPRISEPWQPNPFALLAPGAPPPPSAAPPAPPSPAATPPLSSPRRPESRAEHGPFDGLSVSHRLGFPVLADATEQDRRSLRWRGLELAAPARLTCLAPGTEVGVAARFREGVQPILRLAEPGGIGHCDWVLRWLTGDRTLALLDLAAGWPTEEAERMVVVAVTGPERLQTLGQRECLRALGRILPEVQDRDRHMTVDEAEAALGPFPPAPAGPPPGPSAALGPPQRLTCLECDRTVEDGFDYCPHCGVRRAAPDCPACGKPVSPLRDASASYRHQNGRYAWNTGWDGRCAACGVEFMLRANTPPAHPHLGSTGSGTLTLMPEESVDVMSEESDHLPVLRLRVTRSLGAERSLGKLAAESELVLTHDEWRAVIDGMQGPLRVLLERKRWSRDTP